ncbi:MAG: tetratricopeptide repeat protein [Pseudomonadota bacterium]
MKRISWFIFLFLAIFLGGCAGREDVIILDNRTSSLEYQLAILKDATEGLKTTLSRRIEQSEKKMDAAIQPVHQNQANTLAQFEDLKTQIQALQGRIEAFEYNQKKEQNRLSESLVKDLKELQARLQRLEQPPPPPKPPIPPQPIEPGIKPEKAKENPKEPKEDEKEPNEPVKEKVRHKTSPEELFEEAGVLFKKKAFEGAKKKYEEYLKVDPKGKYVEEARFGLAESLFGAKNYEETILTFQKLIKSYPKSKYVPEAIYKQALSFLSLKDTGSARLLLEKLVKNYPKSSQAKLAQKKLKTI